ncbi:MAG: FAD/NAD(P)-binding protein [Vibrio sp.]
MKFAIIGVGYTGSTLFSKLESILNHATTHIAIDLYDRTREVGAGLAYQKDVGTNILNRPAKAMYMNNKHDFLNWAISSKHENSGVTPESFLQRSIFGEFLKEKLNENIDRYRAMGCHILKVQHQVEEIKKIGNGWCVKAGSQSRHYDAVFLCTGVSVEADPYQLADTPGYQASPYPIQKLGALKGKIGILGCRLTAYDVAMGLDYSVVRHAKMLSRTSDRPRPVKRYYDVELKYLSADNIKEFTRDRETITLESVVDLINQELQHQGVCKTLPQLIMSKQQDNSELGDLVTSILATANCSMSILWQKLTNHSKSHLMNTVQNRWANMRVPISIQNHIAIEKLIARGKVSHSKGIRNVEYIYGKYHVKTDDSTHVFDYIINATGIRRSLDRNNPVLRDLLRRKLAVENQYGGIKVCSKTCCVVSDMGQNQLGLYALGQITCGDFYMVNNIDVINNQVTKVVSGIQQAISKVNICL